MSPGSRNHSSRRMESGEPTLTPPQALFSSEASTHRLGRGPPSGWAVDHPQAGPWATLRLGLRPPQAGPWATLRLGFGPPSGWALGHPQAGFWATLRLGFGPPSGWVLGHPQAGFWATLRLGVGPHSSKSSLQMSAMV